MISPKHVEANPTSICRPIGTLHRRYLAIATCALLTLALPQKLLAHGGLHEQITLLNTELALHPNDANLHFQLAQLHIQHAEWEGVLKSLKRVDQLAPGQFFTDLLRGEAFLMSGKSAKARTALDRFLKTHSDSQKGLLLRARAFQKLGEKKLALADFRAVWSLATKPEPDLVIEIANAFADYDLHKEALEVLSKGIETLGSIPSLVLRAIDLEIASGEYNQALARIQEMETKSPRPEPWMAKRAAILAQAGRIEESRAQWQALLDHLSTLPQRERTSHSMSKLAETARKALDSTAAVTKAPNTPGN